MKYLDSFNLIDKYDWPLDKIIAESNDALQRRLEFDPYDVEIKSAITRLIGMKREDGTNIYTFEIWAEFESDPSEDYKRFPYWLEIDPETSNPTGNVCWATYPGDEPVIGSWIEVMFTGKKNEAYGKK